MMCILIEHRVDGNEIALFQHGIKIIDFLNAELRHRGSTDIRIEAEDARAETGPGHACHAAPDAAGTNQSNRLFGEITG